MAKDFYHQLVKQALEKEAWKITHIPIIYQILPLK